MRAREYISAAAYAPEEREVILGAFEAAWAEIAHHFYGSPISVETARARLADEILAAAGQNCRDIQELKNRGLQAMAMQHRDARSAAASRGAGQRVHDARYWRSHANEALAKADQMTDPECKRLLLGVAETYTRLAHHAEAAGTAKENKARGPGKR